MYPHSFEEITLIKKSWSPMCDDDDFYSQYLLLEKNKPEIIAECGVASGAWINAMNECLSYEPSWIGIENFCSAYLEKKYYGELPNTVDKLYNHIGLDNFTHFYTSWEARNSVDKIDVVRIDMNFYWQPSLDNLLQGTQFVFVDDYRKPNYSQRIDQVIKASGQFELSYSGNQEAILIRNPSLPAA